MGWLLHNPIGDMYGPYFLIFYAGVIVATFVVAVLTLQHRDVTRWEEPPEIPIHPDPYELAYLRGGANEVIRVALFAMIEDGVIELVEEKKSRFSAKTTRLRVAADVDKPDEFHPVERELFKACRSPIEPRALFQKETVKEVENVCDIYKKRAEAESLLQLDAVKRSALTLWLEGVALLVGLAAYKVLAAVENGRPNFGILATLALLSSCFLAVLVFATANQR
jgi:uncharacterized protein (TIGR04222 family)